MTLKEYMADIAEFCQTETQNIIAELQSLRFQNQGEFNDNGWWYDNSPLVIKDKGRNDPLVDSGNLRRQLETASNWDLKPQLSGNVLKLNIPETENFTDSKYDILQTGGKTSPYISPRGNFVNIHDIGSRQFKNLSDQDVEWIKQKLVEAIKAKYT